MATRLLISDANILIDIGVGGLTEAMFKLDYEFATPDLLFHQELKAQHGHLAKMGLQLLELEGKAVTRAVALSQQYTGISSYDTSVLALAEQKGAPLLTGDQKLRQVCLEENVEVHGTLWLTEQMLECELVDVSTIESAYGKMEADGSRLPWGEVKAQLRRYRR